MLKITITTSISDLLCLSFDLFLTFGDSSFSFMLVLILFRSFSTFIQFNMKFSWLTWCCVVIFPFFSYQQEAKSKFFCHKITFIKTDNIVVELTETDDAYILDVDLGTVIIS